MHVIIFVIVLLLAPFNFVFGQSLASPKQARATRAANGAIKLDGQLDDAAWSQATPITDFVQKEPNEGAAPTEPTEVRILYDDTSLYIGARMFSKDPRSIQAPMSRRDNVSESEYLLVSLDTYFDHRTAYTFGVTPSGVRLDQFHPTDNEASPDLTYDPVWQARARIDDKGWTAEFWIPLTQLRFTSTKLINGEMVWGMNIHRWTPTLNEDDYWVAIARTDRGWASRFGELHGFERVSPRRRIELYPYVAGESRVNGNRDAANPFDDGKNLKARAGLDLNMALSSNLTLEATINPDFGQVEADPAEVNLSTVETLFTERRQFFLEGNSILKGTPDNFYYSRRIGARPLIPVTGDFVDYPRTSTILGAAKVTGRMPSGMSLGSLFAVTAEENARTFTRSTNLAIGPGISPGLDLVSNGIEKDVKVAPRTIYSVNRVQQEFGTERSTIGGQFIAMSRDLPDTDPLAALITRRAFYGVSDALIRFGHNAYELTGLGAFTYIGGTPAAIERVQRNPVHTFQRPDRRGGPRLDSSRTSLSGSKTQVGLAKVTGEHWLWGGSFMADSPELEPNDVGRLNDAADIRGNANINYRVTTPGKFLRAWNIYTNLATLNYYGGELGQQRILTQQSNWTFLNFWKLAANWSFTSRNLDPVITRGGPSMQAPLKWNVNGSLSNSASAQTRWTANWSYEHTEDGDYNRDFNGSFSMRPAPAWQISFNPDYRRERSTRQYITQMTGGRPETYGGRYIFGHIERSTMLMQIRFNYTFSPDLTLEFYGEPFAASGRYERIGELSAARARLLRYYGTDGTSVERLANGDWSVKDGNSVFTVVNRDFNVQSFRSNMVLRWEWRPGTTLYVVWQQDRSKTLATRTDAGLRAMFGSLNIPGDNLFVIKTTYRIARK